MKKSLLTTIVIVISIAISSNVIACTSYNGYNGWSKDWSGWGCDYKGKDGGNYDCDHWSCDCGGKKECNGWNYDWDCWDKDKKDWDCDWDWNCWDKDKKDWGCDRDWGCWDKDKKDWKCDWKDWGDCKKNWKHKCKKCPTSPVPAPGALALVGIGVSAVGWLRRRVLI